MVVKRFCCHYDILCVCRVSGESEFVVSATKTAVISASVHGEDANAFIDRSVNVTYTCRSHDIHAIVNLFECVAVTKEGEVTAQLKDADIQSEC